MENMVVGITDCAKYTYYENWIRYDPGVEIIKLSYHQNNFNDAKK